MNAITQTTPPTVHERAERATMAALTHHGIDADQIIDSAKLLDDLNMDSLDVVDAIMMIEDALDLPESHWIPESDNIATVGDLIGATETSLKKMMNGGAA